MLRWATVGIVLAVAVNPARADKLDRVRHEVREESSPAPDRDDDDRHCPPKKRQRPACDSGSTLFLVSGEYVESAAESEPECCFLDYPYADDQRPGYLWIEDEHGEPWEQSIKRQRYVVAQVWAEAGTDFDGLHRIGGRALIDSSAGFGLLGGADVYREDLPGGGTDSLTLGDFNLTVRRWQTERLAFRAGIGARFLTDEIDTDWGINFLVRADVYPTKPLVLSTQLDLGTLGDASVFRFQGTCGYQWHRAELFAGYDYLNIEGAELQGLMAGLRLSF